MAACNVVTDNPAEVVKLNWTTENFRANGDVIFSPNVRLIPNCGEEWRIALRFNDLENSHARTRLEIHLVKKKSCIEECYVELASVNLSGESVEIYSPPEICIGKEKCYLLHTVQVSSALYQTNDLVVDAKLKVSRIRISYNASPRPVIDFGDNYQNLSRDKGHLYGGDTTEDITFLNYQKLSRDLERLYGDTTTADITFLVEGKKLLAHSNIIRCRSTVFAKMIDQNMLEGTRCICITDANFQVFDCFLMYLYTAKLKTKSWNIVYKLYSLADKYAVWCLKKTCSRWLGANLNVNTVSKCIALAALHEDTDLKDVAKQFIRDHLGNVLETSDWKYIISNQPQLASEVLSFATSHSEIRSP